MVEHRQGDAESVKVLLYSDDVDTRRAVMDAIGVRPAPDKPRIEWVESATAAGAVAKFAEHDFAALVLDGETKKIGGMALLRQLTAEFDAVPPSMILIARPQDEWLARFAGTEVVVPTPLTPNVLRESLAKIL